MDKEPSTNIPIKKKRGLIKKKSTNKVKEVRVGTKEIMDNIIELKSIMAAMKDNENQRLEDCNILDKVDQIREVQRSVFDEEVKEFMMQIILSRRDESDLQYKLLEEKLLTGKNYLLEMPRIEKIRTNILGMVQTIEEIDISTWNDESIIDRLQKITGIRMKQLLTHNLKGMVEILVQFKKEIELANDVKSLCEDKNKFDLVKFSTKIREIVETKEYENTRFEFLERWCMEIESNIEKGYKTVSKKENEKERVPKPNMKCIEARKRGRFEISSDEEEEIFTKPIAKKGKGKKCTNESDEKGKSTEKRINESTPIIIKGSSEEDSTIEIQYIEYSTDESD